jgi:hypothetical protein
VSAKSVSFTYGAASPRAFTWPIGAEGSTSHDTLSINNAVARPPRSRFERMVGSSRPSRRRQPLLGLLLGAAIVADRSGSDVLRPLWANEAMQRAYGMVRLVGALELAAPTSRTPQAVLVAEHVAAAELAAAYRDLCAHDERDCLPCSASLRSVVRGLVELFGRTLGDPELRTDIQRVTLPAFQRRALVLATSSILINAFMASFGPVRGVEVELTALCSGLFRLRTLVISPGWASSWSHDGLEDLVSPLDDGFSHVFVATERAAVDVYFRAFAASSNCTVNLLAPR